MYKLRWEYINVFKTTRKKDEIKLLCCDVNYFSLFTYRGEWNIVASIDAGLGTVRIGDDDVMAAHYRGTRDHCFVVDVVVSFFFKKKKRRQTPSGSIDPTPFIT